MPVFVAGHSAWAEGIGEILTPISLPTPWYLVLFPDEGVSTNEIFSQNQLTGEGSDEENTRSSEPVGFECWGK